MFSHPLHDGFQVERSLADPVGQDCAVQIKARTGQDLALAIQRQMVRIFADQHMGQRRLGRQTALDEVRRRLGELGYALPEEEGVLYPENRGEAFRSRLERLIVDESLRFGVPSTHTAFVGVSATRGEAPAVTVGVPNAVPAGWQLKQVRGAADDWSVCQGMRRSPAHPASLSAPIR